VILLLLACSSTPEDSGVSRSGVPSWMPEASITVDEGQVDGEAIVAAALMDGSTAVIELQRDGRVTWGSELPDFAAPSWIGLDGTDVLYNVHVHDRRSENGSAIRVPRGGASWEARSVDTPNSHHALAPLPDGGLAWVAASFQTAEIDGEWFEVAGDQLLEQDEAGNARLVYDFFGDYGRAPWRQCTHFDSTNYYPAAKDWTHVNSLVYQPWDDSYLMVARHLDALIKVDRQSGELIWQLGGEDNDFIWIGQPLSHPHLSQSWEGGLIAFDNGDHREPQFSRVVELKLDEDARTAEIVWEHVEADGAFLRLLGDAKRLDNGNTLVSWTDLGRLDEISPLGELLWRAELPLGTVFGRVDHADRK
jgi:hypothetical protein